MIVANDNITSQINASARHIDARVELYVGSTTVDDYTKTLINQFENDGALKEFVVERIGEDGKFFGFGICQKLTVKLLDRERLINVQKNNIMEIAFGVEGDYTYPCPLFRVESVLRNEANNDISIIAYDFLYKAGEHRVREIKKTSYTIREFIIECAKILGLPVKIDFDDPVLDTLYNKGANFDGSETIRQALNAVAEATQSIFYVDWDWQLTFKRLNKDVEPVITIDKSKYFTLTNQGEETLSGVCHATELGDNVSVDNGGGNIQYVRNNPFWELRDDIAVIVQSALNVVNGMSICQFNIKWRGNWLVEIGDKIAMVTKDDNIIHSYVLNDTIRYHGGLTQTTKWSFIEHNAETASNPITIGDALNQTYAKVDKINREITLNASTAINNLQIGGRNLLRYTDFTKDHVIDEWIVYGEGAIKAITNNDYMMVKNAGKLNTFGIYGAKQLTEIIADQKYTLSFDAFADKTMTLNFCKFMGENVQHDLTDYGVIVQLTNKPQHYEITFNPTISTMCSMMLGMTNAGAYAGAFYFKDLKLELGDKATDYTPAIEDTYEDINALGNAVSSNTEKIAQIKLTTDNITASVENLSASTNSKMDIMENDLQIINNRVSSTMTSEQVELLISTEIIKGSTSCKTATGYTFDEDGLTIKKTNKEMSTQITEDGMIIYKNEEPMLVTNNQGVDAKNLKSNYIIISERSRFEKYGTDRAGCFWIGR